MFAVNNDLQAALFINDQEFLLDQGNSLATIHIAASSLYKLPVMQIRFTDALNLMPKYKLQDGSQLRLQLEGLYKTDRRFRVLNWKTTPIGNGFSYVIDAYWDAPKYWAGSGLAGLTGTSADVLAQIAQKCELKAYPKNAKTSDSMTWMQSNQSYSQFAREIARHGYAGDASHMMLAVDSLGYLRYMDLNNLKDQQQVNVSMVPPAEGQTHLLIKDFQPVTRSGFNNIVGGYRNEMYVQVADSAAVQKVESQITLTSDSVAPLVNAGARDLIERGPVVYSPIDFGNIHPHYERARYQNVRFNLLKSLTGQFLFPFQTPFEPGNQIVFSQVPDRESPEYNGVYTVTEKIVFVQGSSYSEKVIGVKNGLT